jgi:hypothetical protein
LEDIDSVTYRDIAAYLIQSLGYKDYLQRTPLTCISNSIHSSGANLGENYKNIYPRARIATVPGDSKLESIQTFDAYANILTNLQPGHTLDYCHLHGTSMEAKVMCVMGAIYYKAEET